MPLGAIGIGNGWGVAVGPQIGDQVLVVFEGGDFSSGTIVARVFSVAQQAPAVPSGEIWAAVGHPVAPDKLAFAVGSKDSTFTDHGMRWDNSGKNGHYAPIRWSN